MKNSQHSSRDRNRLAAEGWGCMGDGAFCHYCRKSLCECDLATDVLEFREGILDGCCSAEMCFAVSAPLEGFLSFIGYDAQLTKGIVCGGDHYWITLGDRIIDPTADQFCDPQGKQMPPVYIGPKPEWYAIDSGRMGMWVQN